MQEVVYHSNFKIENEYFWFIARNKIVLELFKKYCPIESKSKVLDIGCGTGGFASLLLDKYEVHGMDTEPLALKYSEQRGIEHLYNCYLEDFPNKNIKFNTAFMLDVIEHIEDDNNVVQTAYNLLPNDSYFVATVPAYKWLWSAHDITHMHYRRYTLSKFTQLIESKGFRIEYSSYFNTFLLPIAILKRFIDKITFKKVRPDDPPVDMVSPFINKIFTKVFLSELPFLKKISFPFGLSIIVIAKKV